MVGSAVLSGFDHFFFFQAEDGIRDDLVTGVQTCALPISDPLAFKVLFNALRKKPWIVYAKKPFGSPVHVLDYLGRYTHRVALSNERILSAHNGKITFSYRDRKNHDRKKTMTLDAHEFIRRFLLHVIPKGFVRVRHFGFLANRSKSLLSKCRQLLDLGPVP